MARGVGTVLLVLALLGAAAAADAPPRIAVIVHPSRQVELSPEILGQIYLRRKRFWDDGAPMVPLNLAATTPLRDRFSRRVLAQREEWLAEYWNRQYFYGILPPSTLASTAAILRYVASDPNALGYVPAGEVDGSVRVVLTIE